MNPYFLRKNEETLRDNDELFFSIEEEVKDENKDSDLRSGLANPFA